MVSNPYRSNFGFSICLYFNQIIFIIAVWAKMSILPKFLNKFLIGWRAHTYPIFYDFCRIILKYSDFSFDVDMTKTANSIFAHFWNELKNNFELSKPLKFYQTTKFNLLKTFLDLQMSLIYVSYCRNLNQLLIFYV